ncbi:mediator complex, subunit Med11 [Neohortaea acidophila]|uniref:Mediator of RNA polymerase II transcription subunit 11 n=1 Tax=Neohortaea acidophila TaxID=245834 RepID=A0A6A6PNA3_9PEZI|nr:mediator complex, subunit Med11 [Neohortaea acidophila]KAF2481549.1 mediator complex, subunit Med11 [Neohortaea acidophila]
MASRTISPADRIRELAAINAEVAAILQSAGHAINALTPRPVQENNASPSLEERKEAFTHHTEAYYTGLQSVVAQLRRQTYALEEAGIIAPEASSITSTTQQQRLGVSAPTTAHDSQRITNAGLGNLDVGWLNSRGNKVGAEKENELVKEAKKLLQDVLVQDEGAG